MTLYGFEKLRNETELYLEIFIKEYFKKGEPKKVTQEEAKYIIDSLLVNTYFKPQRDTLTQPPGLNEKSFHNFKRTIINKLKAQPFYRNKLKDIDQLAVIKIKNKIYKLGIIDSEEKDSPIGIKILQDVKSIISMNEVLKGTSNNVIDEVKIFFNVNGKRSVKILSELITLINKEKIGLKLILNYKDAIFYKKLDESIVYKDKIGLVFTVAEKYFEHFNVIVIFRNGYMYNFKRNRITDFNDVILNNTITAEEEYKEKNKFFLEALGGEEKREKEEKQRRGKKPILKYLFKFDRKTKISYSLDSYNDRKLTSEINTFLEHHESRIDSLFDNEHHDRHNAYFFNHGIQKDDYWYLSDKLTKEMICEKILESAKYLHELKKGSIKFNQSELSEESKRLKIVRDEVLLALNQFRVKEKIDTTILHTTMWTLYILSKTILKNKKNDEIDTKVKEFTSKIREDEIVWDGIREIKEYIKPELDIPYIPEECVPQLLKEIHGIADSSSDKVMPLSRKYKEYNFPNDNIEIRKSLQWVVRDVNHHNRLSEYSEEGSGQIYKKDAIVILNRILPTISDLRKTSNPVIND